MFQYYMTQLVRTQSELPLNMFKSFFQKNRKLASGLFVVVLLFIAFTPVPTQAAGFCKTPIIGAGVCGLVLVPMQISAMILYIAGILFDFAIKFTIVDITKNLSNITGINIAWAVIRDLVNISFIFILLYTAIQAILNNTTGQIKQIIVGVVIAAVLINFSLFFTKIIIDGSNLVTLTFQKSMTANCEGKLSFCVMQNLGLPTTYKAEGGLVQTVDGYNDKVLDGVGNEIWKTIILSFGSSIFFLITAFIFLAASVMFVMRFVTIVFLLIFSPLAVIGSILPKLSQKKDEWWSTLTEQAIFPALFMLLMWVVLTILGSPGFITREGSISGALIGGAKIDSPEGLNNLSMVFNFAIIIAFMIGVLTISKGYSKRGGEMGGKFAGSIMGGTLGYTGRQTIGRTASKLAGSKSLAEAASQKGLGGYAARMALQRVEKTAGGSYDPRGTSLGKTLGAGQASSGGFKDRIKADEELRQKSVAKVRGMENGANVRAGVEAAKDLQAVDDARKAIETNTATEEQKAMITAVDAMERTMAKMTGKEIEEMVAGNKKLLDSQAFATSISVQQLDTLNKSEKLSEEEKAKLKNNRFAEASSIVGSPNTPVSINAPDKIRALGTKELEMLSPEVLNDDGFITTMKQSQIDDVMKSDSFTTSQKDRIRNVRKKSFAAQVAANPTILRNKNTSIKQIASLGVDELKKQAVYEQLTRNMLKNLAKEITDQNALRQIREAIMSAPGPITPEVNQLQDFLNSREGKDAYS